MSSATLSAPAEWNEQVTERFVESFRSQLLQFKIFQDRTVDVLTAPVHVEVCPQPEYLLAGAWKVRASIALPQLRFACLCLYCDHEGAGLACLFLRGVPLDTELSAKVGATQVRSFIDVSTAEQALAYVLDFFDAARPDGALVVPGPNFNDVPAQWFSPLLDEEVAECNRILRDNPVSIAPRNDHEFEIGVCVLHRGRLLRRTYTVHHADEHSRLTGQLVTERCHIGVDDPQQNAPLWSLHDNYRAEPASIYGRAQLEWLAAEHPWIQLPPDEIALIKRDLDRYVHASYQWPDAPLWCQTANVTARKRYLSFWERDLVEFRSGEGTEARTAYVLWRPGYGVMLNGKSGPIHQVNDDIRSLRERRGQPAEVMRNVDEALDYVRFFCSHVWGDEGPFTIVEGRSAPELQRATVVAWAQRFGSAEDVLNAIAPLSCVAEQRADSIVEYRLAGWVAYGDALFETELLLHRDGTIEMTDDSPLAELALREDAAPLERWQTYSVRETNDEWLLRRRTVIPAASLPTHGQDCPPIGPDTIENRTFIGPLKTRDLGMRSFRNCRFRSRVDLSGLKTNDSLSFVDCVFEGGLSLNNATIDGTLQLTSCTLLSDGREDESASLDANHLRADAVEIHNVYAARGITMAHAMILQRVVFSSFRTDHGIETALYCYAMRIEHGYFSLRSFRLGGLLSLELARVGTIVDIDSAPETRSLIVGNCALNGLHASNSIRIVSTDIGGALGLRSVQTDSLSVRTEVDVESPIPIYIGGEIDLRDCVITRHVLIASVVAGPPQGATDEATHEPPVALNLRHARIGGDLRLFVDRERGAKLAIPKLKANERHRCDLPQGIDLSNATIEGDVDMAALTCEAGGIDLSDASIACDLLITREPDMPSATARYLRMDGIECAGHTDLSGIQITGGGNVSARFGTFGTTLKVANSTDEGADIEGNLDLTGSTINELAISVRSFWLDRQPTDEDLARHAILLKQAKIEKVTIHHDDQKYPRPIDLRYANVNWWEFRSRDGASNSDDVEQYKGLLNGDPNRQLHTYRSFEQNLVNRGHEDAADEIYWEMRWWLFTDRLSKTWSQIVPTSGDEPTSPTAASSPFTWPFRAVGAAFSLVWQLIIFVAWTLPTSYKRTPAHLLIAMVIWFCISTAIFSLPANIAPSEAGLMANRSVQAGVQPTEWGVSDGAWLALRHHVPIAMFTAREEWEPTNDRPLSIPSVDEPLSWLNAEDYANIVLTLHWLWWPIVLISSSRKYFRRSGQ
jgi:hypothetical protein